MSLGSAARAILGERWFPVIGDRYRAFFVDLEKVVDSFPVLPPSGRVVDVGGGDGAVANILLSRRPDLSLVLLDLAPRIGTQIQPEFRHRVTLLPSMSVDAYLAQRPPEPDAVLVSDVVHHIAEAGREQFFREIGGLLGPSSVLVVKDVEPGTWTAGLALLADRYVTGDRHVSFLSTRSMESLVERSIPWLSCRRTSLLNENPPNYCLLFSAA